MFPPMQRSRNFNPRQMNHGPNQFMSPNQGFSRQVKRGNNLQTMLQQFTQPESAANLASRGAGGLSKTLTNVQQVLKMVESTAPIVQQYGPMVKNLPAMYRMMKAFKEMESTNDDNDDTDEGSVNDLNMESVSDNHHAIKSSDGESKPKLFI
ncbi:YqfQ family protein [Virgibacillus indicus]|nr:YqfQ family protein [Virgibacillus indicus]